MSNALNKIKNIASTEKSSWLDEAKERRQNKAWRKYSFQIAARILLEIRRQKPVNGMTQKLLAEKMGVAPQYINKVLKGRENLTLETISKFEEILNVSLIDINKPEIQDKPESFLKTNEVSLVYSPPSVYKKEIFKISEKPEEDVHFEINNVIQTLFETKKEVSEVDKNDWMLSFYDMVNKFSKNRKLKSVQIEEMENFTFFASEPDEQDWKNFKVVKRSEKSKYENEG